MEETKENKKKSFEERFGKFYDKNYKKLLAISGIILILSFVYLGIFYSQNNNLFYQDISLKGGTSITIFDSLDPDIIEQDLIDELGEINVRRINDIVTGEQQGIIIETTVETESVRDILENYLGYELDEENSSFEFTSSALGESFYRQLIIAILIAFLFMSIVVFLIFRNFVPSAAVILSAIADIIMTLVVVNLLGIELSTAGIIAFLMLIGYSVDTDILLTTRVLKRDNGSVNHRLFTAFKTGTTMTLTSLLAVVFALVIIMSFSEVLAQIFTVLSIGLTFDLFNTWITNASMIKWYAERKK